MSNKNLININSFNVRGLRQQTKRENVFKWLHTRHSGITFIQETHCTANDEQLWSKIWDGQIIFCNGQSNARGVATLIPKNLTNRVIISKSLSDDDGRLLLHHCKVDQTEILLINVYFPTKDKPG